MTIEAEKVREGERGGEGRETGIGRKLLAPLTVVLYKGSIFRGV